MASGSYRIHLPGGRRTVDICTQRGANDFLAYMKGKFMDDDQFQGILQNRNLMKRGDTSAQKRKAEEFLMQQYVLLGEVCSNASSEVFDIHVPIANLENLNDHFCMAFREIAESREWKLTGMLNKPDMELLEDMIPFTQHATFSEVFFNQSLDVLANLCAARSEPQMFALPVAEAVLGIVNNLTISLGIEDVSKRKMFKKLESSGMLPQLFRALTAPVNDSFETEKRMRMIGIFADCKLVKKEFSPGTPSGDMLAAILDGSAGFKHPQRRPNASILMRLKALKDSSALYSYSCTDMQGKMCRNCNLTSMDLGVDQLLKCSRCRGAFYCSAACQKADWKRHKKVCTDRKAFSETKTAPMNVFVQKNYFRIMDEYSRVMNTRELSKAELILELDYQFDENYPQPPALRSEFKLLSLKGCMEGDRPEEPNWFHKGSSVYENNISNWLGGLADHSSRLTSDQLLTVVRHADGSFSIYRLRINSPETGKDMLSDEAVEAYRSRNDNALLEILGQSKFEAYRRHASGFDVVQAAREALASLQAN